MSQNVAIWVLILVSLIGANLPFYIQRPLLFLPWQQTGEVARPAVLRWFTFLAYTACLLAVGWFMHRTLSQTLFVSPLHLLLISTVCVVIAIVMFAIPALLQRTQPIEKSFFARLLEFTALYAFVGLLGVGFESSLGSVFPQRWEFYVITYCLFIILAYPGFVLRYLLKRRRVLVTQPKTA
ncbi:DUF2818 family protein [Paenalcaligenes hominis]|uniref:DUF2818 domain-containing protein n=1 Tax=Paenalcaligenes hominis TaxID=643674 RepID=A0A1U9JZD5_9BURK|nr:DUF2818 family protein [Paenalcaligenes hominis]AQS51138.1 hypothetical protein PAEH1_05315 [Paenalcaligenes hominis]NJB63805.1 hypothetical protein [Paenalcaligenes hominis]GGE60769.1 hypothetical protein GCM10007278_06300 [Paenalcaligenes hominis]